MMRIGKSKTVLANSDLAIFRAGSINPVGSLQFADIGDDFADIIAGYRLDWRHIAKPPVMSNNSI